MNNNIKIIILAAGKGTRMQDDRPKVLIKIKDKSLITYLLESIKKSGVDDKPMIVVGYGRDEVMQTLGADYNYVIQEEQKGTGHAVMMAKKNLENKAAHVMVLYGDHPLIKPETIKQLRDKHTASGAKITMATVNLPDFEDWRAIFYSNFSRIIRDKNGNIIKDVQFKDANEEEKKVTEVNPCYFCFEAKWLWEKLKTLGTNNAQKEYYLTDLIKIAIEEKSKINSININPSEALGVNSKTELEMVEKLIP